MDTPQTPLLARFRATLYQAGLGRRKDALFELLDAALTGPGRVGLVRHRLAAPCRRRWPSTADALADGALQVAALRRLFARLAPAPPVGQRLLWALDGSTWPRPAARTSPERTDGRRVAAGTPQGGVVPGWADPWLIQVPEPSGSWARPLDLARRGPTVGTPTELAIRQLRRALAARPPTAPRPVVTLDSQYDLVALTQAGLPVDLLGRLAAHRVFYRPPGPYRGRGAPRKHGPALRFKDPASHGAPDRQATLADPAYGQVAVAVWAGVHARGAVDVPLTVIRVQVGRLPRREEPPAPRWLGWSGGPRPDDRHELWRWERRRFVVEHGFRFLKQELGWTAVRPRPPAAADRWSWLLAAGLWQRWLARGLVADRRLPWERPVPAARLSPGRVRRAFADLLPRVGTPARPPKPRGKSPGRRPGDRPGPAPRLPVVRRAPPQAA